MANFQVELPDGRKFKVEGVANPEAAYAAIEQMMAQQGGQQGGQQQPAAAQPEQPERYVDPNASRGMFAVDTTQELVGNAIEGTGRFIEQAVPAVGGPMAEYGRSVAEKNAADIARRGYQSTYKGNVSDQSLDTILPFVAEKMIEHSIPTLTTYGGYGAAAVAGALGSVPLATFFATGATLGTLLYGIGETTDELKSKVSKDDYNANAAVIGGTLVAMLDRVGATKALGIDKSKLMSMSLTEVTAALKKAGKGNILKKIARGMAIEGVTEAAQENVIMGTAATQGAEYTFDEILDRNLDSAVIGAAMGGGMTSVSEGVAKTARATKQLFSDTGAMEAPENLPDMTQRAAGDFARRLETLSGEGDLFERKFNLQDLDKMSQTGARAAIDAAHKDLVGQITKSQNELKSELKSDYEKDTLEVLLEKVKAQVGLSMAKNKTKSVVTFGNFKALQDLVGGYTEGQTLMNLIREAQIMTDVHNSGYQGDLSKFTDMFRVFGSEIGYDKSAVAVERVVRPIASFAAGSQFYFLPTIAQQAVASIGTRIDKARGTYSKVDKFVQENKQGVGQPAPRPPSVREQRLQQAQQASSTRAGLQAYNDKRDGGDNINSPVGKILAGTGLSPDGLNKLLDYIETAPDATPDVMEYVDQTRRNLAGEGNNIDDISPWIQAINGTLNQSEELDALREDQPDNPLAQRARRRAGFGPSASQSSAGTAQQQQPQGRSPAVQSGIDANNALADRLLNGMESDQSIPDTQKKLLRTALLEFGARTPDGRRGNIGANGQPLQNALDIVERLRASGVMPRYINDYIMPYVQRVAQQNAGRSAREQQQQQPPSTGTDLAFDEDFDASKPALTDNVPTGAVSGVPMETYLPRAYDIAKREVYKKGRDLKLALQKRSLQAQRSNKINLREMTPVNEDRLADFAVADALEALKTNSNAIGWYNKTVSEALSQMAQVFPEIATDPKAKLQFVWALAATSNGTKVDKNLELAGIAYEHLQKTGRFPTDIGIGKAAKAIRSGLQMYHTMLDKFNGDHAALEQFSNSQFTVKDLEERYGIPISGEGANETVRGAAVLGPKIGNGFFSNLYGNFDALTIDRWNMRTVGRWRGDLVVINKKMIKKKRDELWSILSSMSDEDMRSLRKLYKGTRTKLSNTVMSDRAIDKWANATAKLSQDPDWRNLINDLGFEEVRKKGNGLFGYLDGQREAPSGPTERAFIRRVFEKALDRLNNEPTVLALPSSNRSNQPLNMSDLQALLWYPEKLLYDTAKKPVGEESKGYKDDEAPDYANAARKFVNNRQANSQRGRLGLANGTRGRGRGAGTPIDGPNGQSTSFDQEPSAGSLTRPSPSTGRRGDAGNLQTPSRGQGQGALSQQGPAASSADGQSQHPVQQEDLANLSNATAKDFFARPNWAILTATQENLSDTIKEQRNRENNEELEQKLIKDGIPYIRGTGFYNNEDQGPSFIIVADEATAMAYGKLYSQESILTKDGLVYSLPYPNTPTTGDILSGPEALQKEFYTSTGNLDFYLGLDFAQGPAKPVYKAGYSEAAGRPQLPIRDSDGMVELHHWSDRALTEVDPANAGTGPLNGVERRRGAKLGFFGINVRQNQRDQGTGYVKEGGLGDVEHVGIIDPASLYPINSDPEGFKAGINDISILERVIKDAGYKGYYVEQTGVGSAPLGNVAALFEPLPVTPVTSEQSFDQDAGALTQQPAQQPQQQSPFNMKALVNKMLGSQPATQDQVKAQLPEVRALFEIGKKGSKYEKGIQNLDDALVLADALGLTVRMFDVQQDMMNAVGVGDRVRGVFRSSTKEVFGLKAGTPSDALGTITDLEALTTILHEIGHGMAAGVGPTEQSTLLQMDNDMNSDATAYVNAANPSSQQRSNIETALSGSFEAAMFPHLAIDYTGRGSKIQQEVINLQENIEVYLDKNISETRKVRKILQLRDQAAKDGSGLARLQFVNHLQYVRGNREFAVDPLWVYMANPKLARAVMPMTTALIKKHFKDAQSTDIQFFAHPLAVSLAVVLAMMLNGRAEEEEEEQQRQQMPAGALSPQAGALSQQQQAA